MELFVLLFALAAFVAYFVPTIIAVQRQASVALVILVNLVLGWTGIGWVAALALACFAPSPVRGRNGPPYPPHPGAWGPGYPPGPPLGGPPFQAGGHTSMPGSFTSEMENRFHQRFRPYPGDDHHV